MVMSLGFWDESEVFTGILAKSDDGVLNITDIDFSKKNSKQIIVELIPISEYLKNEEGSIFGFVPPNVSSAGYMYGIDYNYHLIDHYGNLYYDPVTKKPITPKKLLIPEFNQPEWHESNIFYIVDVNEHCIHMTMAILKKILF